MNRVTLIGRLGRDAEIQYTPTGTPLTKFSVATDNNRRVGDKWEKMDPTWHNIVVWGNLAERASSLHKGDNVFIEGKIQVNEYEKDGEKKRAYDIVANGIQRVDRLVAPEGSAETQEDELPGI